MTLPMTSDPHHCCLPISKVCEQAAVNQLMAYMAHRNCLTEYQYGNKKQHSTKCFKILMSDMVFEAIDRKQIAALVLLELSKVFYSIDHTILLNKLRVLGVSREAIE